MRDLERSPAELRAMFGANLRILARDYPSISELSRRLRINRTQFNRYMAGESFPRPDVLARICAFFDVDARVLLEPVESLSRQSDIFDGPELGEFLGPTVPPRDADFPSGFYRFWRRSFLAPDFFVLGLVRVWRNRTGTCFVRGFEARQAMRQQELPTTNRLREFRGLVMQLESGVGMVISRRQGMTGSFNYLHPVTSFQNNYWSGYVGRTMPDSLESERLTRMVYAHLGTALGPALQTARAAGLIQRDAVPDFPLRLLQPDVAFR